VRTKRYLRLNFLNPTWHRGMNTTVRRGDKWFLRAGTDDSVSIHQTGEDEAIAMGTVVSTRYCDFGEVTLRDLWEHHDRECGTPQGLLHAMVQSYPGFKSDESVTVIRFEVE